MQEISKFFQRDRFAAHNDITLVEVRPGYARTEMEISEKHLNGVNITHGGAIFTLADFAFAVASNSHGTVAVGINASISFLHASHRGRLTATAREIHRNAKMATYQVEVKNHKDELLAIFTGTVFRKDYSLSEVTD